MKHGVHTCGDILGGAVSGVRGFTVCSVRAVTIEKP